MIGDAYFQLRAQIGTALFSLARLAGEADAPETTQVPLRAAQAGLRQPFHFVALGPAGSGKSTLLNTLFDRDFCGAIAPAAAGKTAIFKHGTEPYDIVLGADSVECQRPDIFLRDFTIVDTPGVELPGIDLAEALAPFLSRTDLFLFVVAATAVGATDAWAFLRHLGRDALKRTIFIVWQSDRVSADEAGNAVKRLRQAMLKHLGQACPIFFASLRDRPAQEKLRRWIENEIIFSESRRAGFREIGGIAQEALRKIEEKPRAVLQALQREAEQARRVRAALAEHEEQSRRQIAGALWTLSQSFDALRRLDELRLRERLRIADFFRKRDAWQEEFARGVETDAHESLAAQVDGALDALETDLERVAEDHLRAFGKAFDGNAPASPPKFPRAEITQTVIRQEAPIEAQRMLANACARAVLFLRLPIFAVVGAAAIALGALAAGVAVGGSATLALGSAAFALLLALLLRRNVIAAFGHHFATNRAALLAALEPPLCAAIDRFYAELRPSIVARAEALAAERQRHEPLVARIQQLEETFAKIVTDLRSGFSRVEPEAAEIRSDEELS